MFDIFEAAEEGVYTIDVEHDQCYVPYTVNFVYNNSAGYSPTSNTSPLPSPSAGECLAMFGKACYVATILLTGCMLLYIV